jgi:hypothetical protein
MSLPTQTREDVAAVLSAAGHNMTAEEVAAILEFLEQVGSIKKGQAALAVIEELKRAA